MTFQSFADTTTVVTDVMNSVESTMTTIDTSSLYKQIYGDVKVAISGMADALRVGAEHVYEVLVKQQFVNSISNIVAIIGMILLLIMFYKAILYSYPKIDEDKDTFYDFIFVSSTILGSITFILFIVFFSYTIPETVTGFVNPEYGAMKELITWVK